MKILTWNINGIRATKIPLKEVLDSLKSDVICLQETKITRNMLDSLTAHVDGYNAYFSFSRKRSGYSGMICWSCYSDSMLEHCGVVTFCRDSCVPRCAEEGLSGHLSRENSDAVGFEDTSVGLSQQDLIDLDAEGRAVITQHDIRLCDRTPKPPCVTNKGTPKSLDPVSDESSTKSLCIINVYCPRADPDREDRIEYKRNFYKLLQARSQSLLKNGNHVIILGDINATHKSLDHCDPKEQDGQALRARLWIDQLLWQPARDPGLARHHTSARGNRSEELPGGYFLDAFRHLHPNVEHAYTNWSTHTGARLTNYGRRLDYIFVDTSLGTTCLRECQVLSSVEGSDHCPVWSDFSFECIPAVKYPSLCSKYLPEVIGKQKKLSSYFSTIKEKAESSGDVDVSSDHLIKCAASVKVKLDSSSPLCDLTANEKTCYKMIDSSSEASKFQGNDGCSDKSVTVTSHSQVKRSKSVESKIDSKRPKLSKEKSGQASLPSFFQKKAKCRDTSKSLQMREMCENGPVSLSAGSLNATDVKGALIKTDGSVNTIGPLSGFSHPVDSMSTNESVSLSSRSGNGSLYVNSPSTHVSLKTQTSVIRNKDGEDKLEMSKNVTELLKNPNGNTNSPNSKSEITSKWKEILRGPPPPPLCKGHGEACVIRTVKKQDSYNKGRQFYVCAKPQGLSSNPNSRCDHFQWA